MNYAPTIVLSNVEYGRAHPPVDGSLEELLYHAYAPGAQGISALDFLLMLQPTLVSLGHSRLPDGFSLHLVTSLTQADPVERTKVCAHAFEVIGNLSAGTFTET